MLRVESVPAGAEIALNGKPTGEVTPAPIPFTGAGPHTLRLSRRGYVSQEVSVTAADLKRQALSYTLAAVEVVNVPVQALDDMVRDPRYWRQRDPDFIGRVTEGFRKLYAG